MVNMFLNGKGKKAKAGFTLIELLVVIAIIGVLASVVLASLNTARRKSRDARRIADIKQIQLALELYFDANISAGYPTSALFTGAGLAPTYIPVLPKDPLTAANYSYAALGSGAVCSSYHLGAALEDAANPALTSDGDFAAGTVCTGGGTDFAGTDPIYDVKP